MNVKCIFVFIISASLQNVLSKSKKEEVIVTEDELKYRELLVM